MPLSHRLQQHLRVGVPQKLLASSPVCKDGNAKEEDNDKPNAPLFHVGIMTPWGVKGDMYVGELPIPLAKPTAHLCFQTSLGQRPRSQIVRIVFDRNALSPVSHNEAHNESRFQPGVPKFYMHTQFFPVRKEGLFFELLPDDFEEFGKKPTRKT